MMKGTLIVGKWGYRDSSKEENFSVFHATFSFVRGWHSTLSSQIVLPNSACFGLHYSVFLVQWHESDTQNGKEDSQVPKSRMTSFIEVRTSKRNWSLARSKMTFPWIPEQDRYMKARVRSWWHDSEVDRHHVGYLLEINDMGNWVNVGRTSMIWLDVGCEPRSAFGWGGWHASAT
jgi:hypothetical protein